MKIKSYEVLDWVFKIFVFVFVAYVFYQIGHANGYSERSEFQKELDCTSEHSSKPISEVPVKCLKYFDVEAGN